MYFKALKYFITFSQEFFFIEIKYTGDFLRKKQPSSISSEKLEFFILLNELRKLHNYIDADVRSLKLDKRIQYVGKIKGSFIRAKELLRTLGRTA